MKGDYTTIEEGIKNKTNLNSLNGQSDSTSPSPEKCIHTFALLPHHPSKKTVFFFWVLKDGGHTTSSLDAERQRECFHRPY